jgi:hypothetical protein
MVGRGARTGMDGPPNWGVAKVQLEGGASATQTPSTVVPQLPPAGVPPYPITALGQGGMSRIVQGRQF